MTYFTAVPAHEGINHLPANPCKLLDFQLLILPAGQSYSAATGDREVLAVILGGKGTFRVGGQEFANVGGRPNVFAGNPHAVYMPCGADFTVTAQGRLEVGLCSAPSELATAPYVISPEQVTSGMWGAANFSRNFHQILTLAGQPNLPARRLIVGETYTPSGNWSAYPPHKHESMTCRARSVSRGDVLLQGDAGGRVRHGALLQRRGRHGLHRQGQHHPDGSPERLSHDQQRARLPELLPLDAGGQPTCWATVDDPALGWVSRTVPMLKALGH